MTSRYSHHIFRKNRPAYHTFHTIHITYLPYFSHRSHHLPTALFTICASCASIYLPHFSYLLHHLHSPIDHTFQHPSLHFPSPIYHTLHIIRIIYFDTYNAFSYHSPHQPSPIYSTFHTIRVTYLHLSTALSRHRCIVPRSINQPMRPAWRPVTAIWVTKLRTSITSAVINSRLS